MENREGNIMPEGGRREEEQREEKKEEFVMVMVGPNSHEKRNKNEWNRR